MAGVNNSFAGISAAALVAASLVSVAAPAVAADPCATAATVAVVGADPQRGYDYTNGSANRSPLLLTVIALVHRYRAVLPERRSELYEEAVEVHRGRLAPEGASSRGSAVARRTLPATAPPRQWATAPARTTAPDGPGASSSPGISISSEGSTRAGSTTASKRAQQMRKTAWR